MRGGVKYAKYFQWAYINSLELLINVLAMFQKCVKDMMYCFEDGPNSDE